MVEWAVLWAGGLGYSGPEGSHMQIKNSTCKLKILPTN